MNLIQKKQTEMVTGNVNGVLAIKNNIKVTENNDL